MSASQQYFMTSAAEAGIDIRNMQRAGILSSSEKIFADLELHSSGERGLLPHEINVTGRNDEAMGDDDVARGTTSEHDTASAERTTSLISKMRQMHNRMRTSAFYVQTEAEIPDVDRHRSGGDDGVAKMRRLDTSSSSSAYHIDIDAWCGGLSMRCLGGMKRTRGEGGGVFVPEELCVDSRRRAVGGGVAGGSAKRLRALNLAELAAKIRRNGGTMADQHQQGSGVDAEDDDGLGEDGDIPEDGEESDGVDYAANYYESEGDDMSGGSDGEPTF